MQNRKSQLEDELLVIRCQQGESEAFGELVERWQGRLWGYACKVTGSEDAAWDLVQETWCGVIKGLRRLQDVSVFPGWVFRLMHHKCIDWIRKQQRRARLQEGLESHPQDSSNASQSEMPEVIRQALNRLAPDRRALIVLRYWEGFGTQQIAGILMLPEGTVKSRLHRTIHELRQETERDSNE